MVGLSALRTGGGRNTRRRRARDSGTDRDALSGHGACGQGTIKRRGRGDHGRCGRNYRRGRNHGRRRNNRCGRDDGRCRYDRCRNRPRQYRHPGHGRGACGGGAD
ncbi:hypothetical protein NJBCHELONAE_46440 [Mycobacteroides chelonae]|nr:hypothetical protein NJBCHELONAE_46440 [Mycobacteroides chelonae]